MERESELVCEEQCMGGRPGFPNQDGRLVSVGSTDAWGTGTPTVWKDHNQELCHYVKIFELLYP